MEEKLSLKEKLDRLRAAQPPGPRKSSDVLVDRQADGQPAAGDDAGSDPGDLEAATLERDLMRAQAAEDAESSTWRGHDKMQDFGSARDVELEAELQALRQELDLLRNAVRDKDRALEDLAAQCRTLEDALEDRDRDLDRLYQELEQARSGLPPTLGEKSGLFSRSRKNAGHSGNAPHGFEDRDTSEVLDGTSLIFTPPPKPAGGPNWIVAGLAGLLVGFVLVAAALYFTDNRQPSASAPVARQPVPAEAPPPSPAPAAETADRSPPPPANRPARELRDTLRNGAKGPTLMLLPGGSFTMGNKRGLAAADEQPAHEVQIAPLYLGQTEVTFEDYDRFARATGRPLPEDDGWGRGNQPVIHVSWDDASAYAAWLSRQTGQRYRLPSEAEWEYAARAGSASRYWWGFQPGEGHAVCFDCGSAWDNRRPAPAGSLAPNPYGLYDTAGNVMEWVEDCVNAAYRGAPADGSPWQSGDCNRRMIRGGAFNKPARSMRSSARYHLPRDAHLNNLGFRVARDP